MSGRILHARKKVGYSTATYTGLYYSTGFYFHVRKYLVYYNCMKLTTATLKIFLRSIALFAYIATLVLGNGIHIHSAFTSHNTITVHMHETVLHDQSYPVFFHPFEDHNHYVATIELTATQTRVHTNPSSVSNPRSPQIVTVSTFFSQLAQPLSRRYFDSRQYSPLDCTSLHSSGSDPPSLYLS